MNRQQLKVMIKKEYMELVKEKGLLLSLLGTNKEVSASIVGLNTFLEQFKLMDYPAYLTKETIPLYAVLTYFFLPLFMLQPIMFATLLASNSFIGEKEHKTLEGLLYTPLSPKVLILGKALGCYTLVVNTLGWGYFGHLILPNLTWLLVILVISPLLVFLSILLIIGSSQYLKNSKSAQGVSMIIVMPIIGILLSQSTGV